MHLFGGMGKKPHYALTVSNGLIPSLPFVPIFELKDLAIIIKAVVHEAVSIYFRSRRGAFHDRGNMGCAHCPTVEDVESRRL